MVTFQSTLSRVDSSRVSRDSKQWTIVILKIKDLFPLLFTVLKQKEKTRIDSFFGEKIIKGKI